MKKTILLGIIAVGSAFADLTPSLVNISSGGVTCDIAGSPVTCTYNYIAHIDSHATLVQNQSQFTIYDFALVPDTYANRLMAPTGWSADVSVAPAPTGITDNPALPNISFTYTGPTMAGTGEISGFSGMSFFSGIALGQFYSASGVTTQSGGLGTVICLGPVDVPGPGQGDVGDVPEPVSMGMLGGGLLGLGLLRLRRKAS